MLSKISWSEFIWLLAFLLVPYYLSVLALYFRKEALAFLRNPTFMKAEPSEHKQQGLPFSVIHDLLEELKMIFANAVMSKMVKEELVQALCSKLKNYPALRGADLQHDVNQHIKIEAKDQCGFVLDESDMRQIWQP
jgi:hypothetical protein